MKVLSYDALARDFPKAWDAIETKGEEVMVTRRRRRVARIVPELAPTNALEVFGDLHGLLGEAAGAILATGLADLRKEGGRRQSLQGLRNPWAS